MDPMLTRSDSLGVSGKLAKPNDHFVSPIEILYFPSSEYTEIERIHVMLLFQVDIFYSRGLFVSWFSKECLPHQILDLHITKPSFLPYIEKGRVWGRGCIYRLHGHSL